MTSLADVVSELYALSLSEFTAARNEQAARARLAGATEAAVAIKALRKPSSSAWALNLVARQEPDQLDEVLQVGVELRAATEARAGEQLRRLSRERHQAIAAVTASATRLAVAAGARMTDAMRRDVASTLDAAVADEGAAAAVRSGALVRALVPSGFDAVDLDGAVADPSALALVAARPRLHTVAATEVSGADEAAADQARNLAALAERSLVRAESNRGTAEARAQVARERVSEAQRLLAAATAELAELEPALAEAEGARDEARVARDQAQRAVRTAEAARRPSGSP